MRPEAASWQSSALCFFLIYFVLLYGNRVYNVMNR